MELLEYQAKELFRRMGIPVLPSQRIDQPRDLKQLTIPYPVVLKSQVYTGGRGKAGGIRFVQNTIDAMAAAQAIFHLPISGKYPAALLAEAKYDADLEFYLAVILDSLSRRPLLLGSRFGGEAIESKLNYLQQVVVDQEFSPFYARRLAVKMGLEPNLILSVSAIVEKMFDLFLHYDLDLVEINPLAINANGSVMALDGKVTVNDAALGRHPDLIEFLPELENGDRPPLGSLTEALQLVPLDGNIGVLCNGGGLSMATLDLIYRAKGKSAGFVDLGGEYRQGRSPNTLQERIQQGLTLLSQSKSAQVILINILGNTVFSCLQVAETLTTYSKQLPSHPPIPPLVVRLVGDRFDEAQALLEPFDIPVLSSLDEAIAKAVAIAKSSKG